MSLSRSVVCFDWRCLEGISCRKHLARNTMGLSEKILQLRVQIPETTGRIMCSHNKSVLKCYWSTYNLIPVISWVGQGYVVAFLPSSICMDWLLGWAGWWNVIIEEILTKTMGRWSFITDLFKTKIKAFGDLLNNVVYCPNYLSYMSSWILGVWFTVVHQSSSRLSLGFCVMRFLRWNMWSGWPLYRLNETGIFKIQCTLSCCTGVTLRQWILITRDYWTLSIFFFLQGRRLSLKCLWKTVRRFITCLI